MPISIAKGINFNPAGDLALKFYGRIPIGGIVPVIGAFQLTSNSGTFTSASLPSSGSITDDGFQRCDGAVINNANSVFNGKYTPDITDSRFVQGSTSAGGLGGGGNNGNNTHTISISNLPTHTHDISHSHSGTTGTVSANHSHGGTTQNAGDHFHAYAPYGVSVTFNEGGAGNFRLPYTSNGDGAVTFTDNRGSHAHGFGTGNESADHTHSFSSTSSQSATTSGNGGFSNTAIDIRPKYINAVYLIRVI